MSFLAYLYLLRASFRKFFNSKEAIVSDQEKTLFTSEVNIECKESLRKKCMKAAIEVQYVGSFTHWPIAKPKIKTKNNSLVYLDVNRSKRATLEQRNKRTNHGIAVSKNTTLTNNVTTVKKIPNH